MIDEISEISFLHQYFVMFDDLLRQIQHLINFLF